MIKAKNKELSRVFFIALIACVGAATLCGWVLSKQLTEEKLDDILEQIDDKEEELKFANDYKSNKTKSGSLAAAKAKLEKLEKENKITKNEITNKQNLISLESLESLDFVEMEQSVSMLAMFMEENGLNVSSLAPINSNKRGPQFMEVNAQGFYLSILGAINACMDIEGLIVKDLAINQVDNDGELTLKLSYTFNKSQDDATE